jgi:hypothetical protein
MENIFKSNDFYLCAVCIASGASLVSLNRDNNKFATFVLDIAPEKAEEIITKHWNRELRVPTRDLIEAINELKTRLHSNM